MPSLTALEAPVWLYKIRTDFIGKLQSYKEKPQKEKITQYKCIARYL